MLLRERVEYIYRQLVSFVVEVWKVSSRQISGDGGDGIDVLHWRVCNTAIFRK